MLVHPLQTNQANDEVIELVGSHEEDRMRRKGIERFQARQDRLAKAGSAAERCDFSTLIRRSLLDVASRVDAMVDEATSRKRGVKSNLLLKIKDIEGITVAYLTMSTIFSSLIRENDWNRIATKLGAYLEHETQFHFIAEQNPKLWERLVRYAKERGSYRHKTEFVLNTAAKEGTTPPEWTVADRTFIGSALLKLVEDAGLIVKYSTGGASHHTKVEVQLAEEVIEWLSEHRRKADAGLLPMVSPILGPMTTVPVDWTCPYGGGYQTLKYELVKRNGTKADYTKADMTRVYRAVNLMQHTAWHINPVMLALIEYLWAAGEEVGKLPNAIVEQAPEKLSNEVWAALDDDAKKMHRLERRDLHERNRQAVSDLASIEMLLTQARDLEEAPALYMPYQLDWRGRAYCSPMLNPQAVDYIRSLLEFSEGKAVGERGGMWLGIQVASLWDGQFRGKRLSKSSFQDRYDWACENEEMLRSVVDDPLGDRRWQDADKPFMFLRTAMDWVGFLDYGEAFISQVPVALDGSCSGIQHYSANLRDEVGGASVNLIPTDEPADVYTEVAEAVLQQLAADAPSTERDFWLGFGITRKTVKKPVMTYGYSSREAGFTDWFEKEYVRPTFKKQGVNGFTNPTARYLARITLAAVEQRLVGVAKGMEWLIACAALLAHEGKGVTWTAPSGFPVSQAYRNAPSVRVETHLMGERLRVSIPGTARTISKEKQKSGISPNHTHSLDAAHLVLTTLVAADEYGITDFALIHDSFGTLAADTDGMFSAVREAFVVMYEEHDPFQELYDEVFASLSEEGKAKLPKPPSEGALDLSNVRQALYAFA